MKPFGQRPDPPEVTYAAAATASSMVGAPVLSRLRAMVLEQLDPGAAAQLPREMLRKQIEPMIHDIATSERIHLSATEEAQLAIELTNDMVGYGPLEMLLADDNISDIMVNGPHRVFVEVQGKVLPSPVRFRDAQHVATVAQKMVGTIGRRVDESSPLCDARLPDGSRVNVIFPPLALDGPCISIRKFSRMRIDFEVMAQSGSVPKAVGRLLQIAARSRLNVLISGGTGSGKTTLLNAMSQLIDEGERVVTIEDAAELQLQQPHVVRLETRPANLEGHGQITQRDLLRNALRMRPDRIVVGEVRGEEALDMLQAMNTGHDGSICTIHANSARDALTRIENMVQMGAAQFPIRAIRTQIAGALDLVVQLERMRDGVRRLVQLSDVCGMEGDVITMNDIVTWNYEGENAAGGLMGTWHSPALRPSFGERLRMFGLEKAWLDTLQEV
jgi:pilus assembly protein CpaF